MTEKLKSFHDDFIRFFQTRDKHETNLLICQILLYGAINPELKRFDEIDDHANYHEGDTEYVDEFVGILFDSFTKLTDGIFPEMKKFVKDAIDLCKSLSNQGVILKLFRNICRLNEEIENLNAELFDEFYSYTTKTKQRNSEWTPETICKIFALFVKDYFKKFDDIKTILDPCIGANKLVHYVSKQLKINPIVYGYDIVPVLTIMTYLDLLNTDIKHGVDISQAGLRHHISCKDLFSCPETDDLADLCVCNPPYTKKLSGHDALEFAVKSMTLAKYGIFIFPSNQIRGNICPEVQKELLKVARVDRVLVLGSKVFNGVGAGDICIMCCTNLKMINQKEQPKTIVQIIDYYDYINRIPHSIEDVLKPERKKELINLVMKRQNATVIDVDKLNWCGAVNLFLKVENNEIVIDDKNIDITNDIEVLKYFADEEILQNFKNSNHVMTFEDVRKDILKCEETRKTLRNLDNNRFKLMKFEEIFEVPAKMKSIKTEQTKTEGKYPYIAAAKTNNGIKGYTDEFHCEASEEKPIYTLCVAGDGATGYVFKQTSNFTKASGVYVLYPNIEFNDINTYILTAQLINMGFGFSNKINKDNFKDISVYIYV